MKQYNHILIIILLLIFPVSEKISAQKTHVGLAPMFQKTLHQAGGEFDMNLTPFVLEGALDVTAGVRLFPIVNFSFAKGEKPVFKNAGLELSLPIYYLHLDNKNLLSHHLFVAPGGMFLGGKGMMAYRESNIEVSLFLEPGYSIWYDEEMALTAGVQLGKTFVFKEEQKYWTNFLAFRLTYTRLF